MKHLSILVPEGSIILDTVIGTLNMFRMANSHAKRSGKQEEDLFKVDLVSHSMEPLTVSSYFQVTPTATLTEIERTDLIIIASIAGDLPSAVRKNQAFIPWIRERRVKDESEIVSLCRSAFLLAETGLMNGKTCTTHWAVHDEFQKRYPRVHLMPDQIISEDSGIYSSGGAYSFLNMILYLIEQYYGRETAIWCSKMAEIDFDRISQNQFVIFSGQKDHQDSVILEVQDYIEAHYTEKLNMEELAEKFALSNRSFLRRFKKATHNSPFEYVQRVKIEAAKKSLESSPNSISQVMYAIGYQDEKAFRKTFKKYTGLSPLAYRRKFNREMAFS